MLFRSARAPETPVRTSLISEHLCSLWARVCSPEVRHVCLAHFCRVWNVYRPERWQVQTQTAQDLAYAPVGEDGLEQLLDQIGGLGRGPQAPILEGWCSRSAGSCSWAGVSSMYSPGVRPGPPEHRSWARSVSWRRRQVRTDSIPEVKGAHCFGRVPTVIERASSSSPQSLLLGGDRPAHVIISHVRATHQEPTNPTSTGWGKRTHPALLSCFAAGDRISFDPVGSSYSEHDQQPPDILAALHPDD